MDECVYCGHDRMDHADAGCTLCECMGFEEEDSNES